MLRSRVPVVDLALGACASHSLGVHRVELGESLGIELDVVEGAPEIVVRVDGRVRCREAARCEVRGLADVEVGVEAEHREGWAHLDELRPRRPPMRLRVTAVTLKWAGATPRAR